MTINVEEIRAMKAERQQIADGIMEQFDKLLASHAALLSEVKRLRVLQESTILFSERDLAIAHGAFRSGYASGHDDTVEGMYDLDESGRADEWLSEAKNDGTMSSFVNGKKAAT